MDATYVKRLWVGLQSLMFVTACAVVISYGLAHMSVVGVSQVALKTDAVAQKVDAAERTAGRAVTTANQAKAQSSQADATAQAAQRAAETAAHRKFMAEKNAAKFMDLEARVRSLERSRATLNDQIQQLRP